MALAWALAVAGMAFARHLKVTPESIQRYLAKVDFTQLSPAERKLVIQKLAAMLNALTPEERRAVRMNRAFDSIFRAMNDSEKGEFMELTLPAGFNQMLSAFEQLPEDKRRKAIDDTLRRMREEMAAATALDDSNELAPPRPRVVTRTSQQARQARGKDLHGPRDSFYQGGIAARP
jgi:transcription-repair coupling factor (superfamily II helicase)